MIDPAHPQLSVVRQCELGLISRSGFYYQPVGETPLNLELMRLIDRQFLETPWYGSRQMARHLRHEGYPVGRKRVRRLMAKIGLASNVSKTTVYDTSCAGYGSARMISLRRYLLPHLVIPNSFLLTPFLQLLFWPSSGILFRRKRPGA